MVEGEKVCSFHRSTENSLAIGLHQMQAAYIGESSMASSKSDRSEIAAGSISSSTSPASAFLKIAAPVFPSYKLTHHSSDSSLVAVTIKVPIIIHSWPDGQRKAQLVANW